MTPFRGFDSDSNRTKKCQISVFISETKIKPKKNQTGEARGKKIQGGGGEIRQSLMQTSGPLMRLSTHFTLLFYSSLDRRNSISILLPSRHCLTRRVSRTNADLTWKPKIWRAGAGKPAGVRDIKPEGARVTGHQESGRNKGCLRSQGTPFASQWPSFVRLFSSWEVGGGKPTQGGSDQIKCPSSSKGQK